jgi:hypothetical protein
MNLTTGTRTVRAIVMACTPGSTPGRVALTQRGPEHVHELGRTAAHAHVTEAQQQGVRPASEVMRVERYDRSTGIDPDALTWRSGHRLNALPPRVEAVLELIPPVLGCRTWPHVSGVAAERVVTLVEQIHAVRHRPHRQLVHRDVRLKQPATAPTFPNTAVAELRARRCRKLPAIFFDAEVDLFVQTRRQRSSQSSIPGTRHRSNAPLVHDSGQGTARRTAPRLRPPGHHAVSGASDVRVRSPRHRSARSIRFPHGHVGKPTSNHFAVTRTV